MEDRLDLPPELKVLIEKRESLDRRASDRRGDQLDENDDTQEAEPGTEVQATDEERRRATRRKKPRRNDD